MSSTTGGGSTDSTSDSPSPPAASSPSSANPPGRPLPGAAGEGDGSEETTTQPPRFTLAPTTTNVPPTTTKAPEVTTSNPPPPPPSSTTTSSHQAATTRPPAPDPPQQTTTPASSPTPSPAADSPSPQSPTAVAEPGSPTSAASPLAGVNNFVSPTAGGATALAASSPLEIVSILSPTTLADGTTTTIAIAPQPVLLTPSTSQGFVTATRARGAQPTDGAASPTGSGDSPLLTPSEKRGRDSAQITGIALGALVVILLALVFIPKFIRMFKNRDKGPSKADKWKPGQTGDRGIGYQKREKEDDEVSWFSGSTTHGGLSEDGRSTLEDEKGGGAARVRMRSRGSAGGDDSSFHLVQTLPYQPRSKNNIAGIGRRDTLKSIVQVRDDVPPPQAEFVAMPRTPTIIYSPPPEDSDLAVFRSNPRHAHESDFDTPARRNILTPLTFPTTPSSFPSTPASAHGHNPFSTPPLSGLYSSSEWQHILATPPDHRDADTPSPPPSAHVAAAAEPTPYRDPRRRSTLPSPNLSHCAPPSSYNETDSIYSVSGVASRRSSMITSIPSASPTGSTFFHPPSQAQLLRNLRQQQQQQQPQDDGIWPSEVRLEGLAKAAARIGAGGGGRDGPDDEEILLPSMTDTTQAQAGTREGVDRYAEPEMPRHLAERLEHDREQFEKHLTPTQLDESLTAAQLRHDHAIETKHMAAHDDVEHVRAPLPVPDRLRNALRRAREVAATHEPRPEDDVPGRVLHSDGDKLIPGLESSVQAKKASVSEKQRELQLLEERLRDAEAKEAEMKRKLGLIG
ncbi:hypothetical protein JCM11491_003103 [Sporobolomyces phaffii]